MQATVLRSCFDRSSATMLSFKDASFYRGKLRSLSQASRQKLKLKVKVKMRLSTSSRESFSRSCNALHDFKSFPTIFFSCDFLVRMVLPLAIPWPMMGHGIRKLLFNSYSETPPVVSGMAPNISIGHILKATLMLKLGTPRPELC